MHVDTNLLVDYIRGKKLAVKFLEDNKPSLKLSIIVKLELIQGIRSKKEIESIEKTLTKYSVKTIHIKKSISQQAEILFTKFRHSKGISINDSLIAASAIIDKEKLVTHNQKHFNFIPTLKLTKPY